MPIKPERDEWNKTTWEKERLNRNRWRHYKEQLGDKRSIEQTISKEHEAGY